MPVYWPGGRTTRFELRPWLFPDSLVNVGLVMSWVLLWFLAFTVWVFVGYWLALKYTVLAGLAMIGAVGAFTLFGIRFARLF